MTTTRLCIVERDAHHQCTEHDGKVNIVINDNAITTNAYQQVKSEMLFIRGSIGEIVRCLNSEY